MAVRISDRIDGKAEFQETRSASFANGNSDAKKKDLTLWRARFTVSVEVGNGYQLYNCDAFSIGLETRCQVGTKPSVEIQHLQTVMTMVPSDQ